MTLDPPSLMTHLVSRRLMINLRDRRRNDAEVRYCRTCAEGRRKRRVSICVLPILVGRVITRARMRTHIPDFREWKDDGAGTSVPEPEVWLRSDGYLSGRT